MIVLIVQTAGGALVQTLYFRFDSQFVTVLAFDTLLQQPIDEHLLGQVVAVRAVAVLIEELLVRALLGGDAHAFGCLFGEKVV